MPFTPLVAGTGSAELPTDPQSAVGLIDPEATLILLPSNDETTAQLPVRGASAPLDLEALGAEEAAANADPQGKIWRLGVVASSLERGAQQASANRTDEEVEQARLVAFAQARATGDVDAQHGLLEEARVDALRTGYMGEVHSLEEQLGLELTPRQPRVWPAVNNTWELPLPQPAQPEVAPLTLRQRFSHVWAQARQLYIDYATTVGLPQGEELHRFHEDLRQMAETGARVAVERTEQVANEVARWGREEARPALLEAREALKTDGATVHKSIKEVAAKGSHIALQWLENDAAPAIDRARAVAEVRLQQAITDTLGAAAIAAAQLSGFIHEGDEKWRKYLKNQ